MFKYRFWYKNQACDVDWTKVDIPSIVKQFASRHQLQKFADGKSLRSGDLFNEVSFTFLAQLIYQDPSLLALPRNEVELLDVIEDLETPYLRV